jgi:hypothetical protein
MTTRMQRLLSRVDGTPPLIAPISILNVSPGADERSGRSRRSCRRSDWMGGRAPKAIERVAVTEPTELREERAAAGLM